MGGGGPGFVFNMGGGPGIRVHQFGGGRPRRRPPGANGQPEEQPTAFSSLAQLLPLVFLFIIPLLSSLFSGATTPSGPSMRFDAAAPPHTHLRTSHALKVPYWVNPRDVEDYSPRKWREVDKYAEVRYVNQLNVQCENEQNTRQRLFQESQGWFWVDEAKLEQARRMDLWACNRLREIQRM